MIRVMVSSAAGCVALAGILWGLDQCGAAPTVPGSPVDVGIDTATCILRVSIEDAIAGKDEATIINDCIHICGATRAQVSKVRTEYAAARDLESHARDGGK